MFWSIPDVTFVSHSSAVKGTASCTITSATPTQNQPVCRRGTHQETSCGRFSDHMIRNCMNER